MSFFYDVLSVFNMNELGDNLSISYIENKGIFIVGKFKVEMVEETMICLKTKKQRVDIFGENLSVKTMAKGEIAIEGKILNINFGGKNDK